MKKVLLVQNLLFLLFSLAACDVNAPALNNPEMLKGTLEAMVTLIKAPAGSEKPSSTQETLSPQTDLFTQVAGQGAGIIPTVEQAVQNTPLPEAKTGVCNRASAGFPIDVTIPDGTVLWTGQYFNKTWKLINAGNCTWDGNYGIAWFSGERFSAPAVVSMPAMIAPGEAVLITLELKAPGKAGSFQGFWKLLSPEDQWFGIGPNGDGPFWVKVQVVQLETETPQPTATPVPTIRVAVSGEVNLVGGDVLDLDTGLQDPIQGDLKLEVAPEGNLILVPINQASFAYFGLTAPQEWECNLANLTQSNVDLKSINNGSHLCFKTSQGLPGFITVNTTQNPDGAFSLRYITWFLP